MLKKVVLYDIIYGILKAISYLTVEVYTVCCKLAFAIAQANYLCEFIQESFS